VAQGAPAITNEYVASLRVVDTHPQGPVQPGAKIPPSAQNGADSSRRGLPSGRINEQQRNVLGARLEKEVRVLVRTYPTSRTPTNPCLDDSSRNLGDRVARYDAGTRGGGARA